jgi:polyhydroxyalkanoate synthesis regulator phasin
MTWYLRKLDNTVYGPVDLDVLKGWAAQGRVHPDDRVSQDNQTWRPAPEISQLHMDWIVDLAEGKPYGPLHLLAIRELIREGTVKPEGRLTHKATHQAFRVGDELLKALTAHVATLEETIDALQHRIGQLEGQPGPGAAMPPDLEALARELAAMRADVARLSGERATEAQAAAERNRAMDEKLAAAHAEAAALRSRLDALQEAHAALVREHRELNDRYVKSRGH